MMRSKRPGDGRPSSRSRARGGCRPRASSRVRGGRCSGRRPSAERRPRRTARRSPRPSIAGPSGSMRRRPEQLRRHAAAGQVAIADDPDARPGRAAPPGARGAPRAGRRCGRRRRRGCARTMSWRRGVVDRSPSARPRRRPATRAASPGSSIAPKCSPTKIEARPGVNASATRSGVSMSDPLVDVARAQAGRAGHLEVVARGMPVGEPDETLQGARVGGGRPDAGRAPAATRPGPRRRGAGSGAPGPRDRAWRGTRGRRASSASGTSRPLGQAAGQPGRDEQQPEAAASRRTARPWSGELRRRSRIGDARLHQGRAPLEVGGLLGRGRPDRLEAVPLVRRRGDGGGERVGDRLGRALELGRIVRDRGRSDPATSRGTSRRAGAGS